MDSLLAEFQPQTANETALVETMAVSRWKLSRNWIMHTALLEVETVKQDPSAGNEPVLTALAFKSLADSSHSLHLLHRYEVSLDRQYSRALNNLLKVRAARTAVAAPIADPPSEDPAPTPTEEVETAPEQALPNKPNLPARTARKPVEMPRGRPVSVTVATSPTENPAVREPKLVPPSSPRAK
jgi:hypothetical protein